MPSFRSCFPNLIVVLCGLRGVNFHLPGTAGVTHVTLLPHPTCMPSFCSCSPAVSALAEQLFEARHTAPGPAGQPSVPDLLAARVRVLNMKLAPASDGAVNPCPMPQVRAGVWLQKGMLGEAL